MECKECVHNEVCRYVDTADECSKLRSVADTITMPCHIGSIVYEPIKWANIVDQCKVSGLTQKANGSWKIRLTSMYYHSVYEITAEDIGKRVFFDEVAAAEKLRSEL